MLASLGDLVRGLQHLHQEGVNGRVPNQFEEEQVLQAFQANGAQRRQPEEQLCKPGGWRDVRDNHRPTGRQKHTSGSEHVPPSCCSPPALLIGVLLLAVRLQRCIHSLPQQLHFTGVGQTLGICRCNHTTFTVLLNPSQQKTGLNETIIRKGGNESMT